MEDVIELEKRKKSRIRSRSTEMMPDIGVFQMQEQGTRQRAAQPLVEVPEHDSHAAVRVAAIDDPFIEQPPSLLAMFG